MNASELYTNLSRKYQDSLSLSDNPDPNKSAFIIKSEQLIPLLQELKVDHGFVLLILLTAVDYPDRYEMNYRLLSVETGADITIKVNIGKTNPTVSSLTSFWPAARVQEREVYDLFGIAFSGHDDLKRILTPEGYTEFPLRKSFKLDSLERQSKEILIKGQIPHE